MSANAHDSDTRAESDSEAEPRNFPTPPRTVTDECKSFDEYESPDEREAADERESLAAMYDAFGTADRAQGIPPASPRRREAWLDRIADGVTVVAYHGDRAVGHGVLLGDGTDHELALFVHPEYRRAGIGSALLRTLLGRGRAAGVERVWLSVQRTNRPAVHLYRKVGFRADGDAGDTDDALGVALKMHLSL